MKSTFAVKKAKLCGWQEAKFKKGKNKAKNIQ
jgi:hypothetical protein